MAERRLKGCGCITKMYKKHPVTGKRVEASPYFYILYRDGARRIRECTGSKVKAVAEATLQRRMGENALGIRPAQDVKNVKYEHIRDAYLSHYRNQGGFFFKARDGSEYVNGMKHLDRFFKGVRATDISSERIDRFTASRRKDGVADPTIRRNLVILRGMLNLARKQKNLRQADVPHFSMPKDSEAAGQYIDPENFAKLRAALPKDLRPFFTFLYATGCRLGAAKAITWAMISKDRTEITIPADLMKAHQPLTLVLAGALLEPIAAMLKKMFPSNALVFCSVNYRTEWNRACAKVPGLGTYDKETRTRTGVRIHDCRASAAVNLVDAGVSEDTVMKIGGWKTKHMFSRYNVMNTERIRAAMIQGGKYVSDRMAAQG